MAHLVSYFYKTILQMQFKLHLHFFSPHFNYWFHGTTAALLSVIKESVRREVCQVLMSPMSFLEKRTLVCLQIQDKAHRRFKWGRDLLRVFFRFLFILKGANDRTSMSRCSWASFTNVFSSELWRHDIQVLSNVPEQHAAVYLFPLHGLITSSARDLWPAVSLHGKQPKGM